MLRYCLSFLFHCQSLCYSYLFIHSASASSSQSAADSLNVGLLLQLAITAMGLFTLLAVVIIAVVMCRRSSASIGVYSKCSANLVSTFIYLLISSSQAQKQKTCGKESPGVGHFPCTYPYRTSPPDSSHNVARGDVRLLSPESSRYRKYMRANR